MIENWRPVVGDFRRSYEVSDQGRVRSVDRRVKAPPGTWRNLKGRVLKPGRGSHEYFTVALSRAGKKTSRFVHRLVLEAFVGLRSEGMQCRHLDGDPKNNHLENLCWGTSVENKADMARHGTLLEGERNHRAKLSNKQVRDEILPALKAGETQRTIAGRYGVSWACISDITRGKSFSSVTGFPKVDRAR